MGVFTFTPPSGTNLGSNNVYTELNHAISVEYNQEGVEDTAIMDSTTIEADLTDSSVILTDGIDTATISGEYTLSVFPNQFIEWVDKAESDLTQTPGSTNDITLVPPLKDLITAKPDNRASITINYTVTATTDDLQTHQAFYTYTVVQTYDAIKDWITDYIANNQGA